MGDSIASITLKDFKSFAGRHEIKLAPLTILAGVNSSGKSSVIQALKICKSCLGKRFLGNYGISDIGHFDDILCDRSDADTFAISIKFGNNKMPLEIIFSDKKKTDNSKEQKELLNNFSKMNFYFSSAHRLGPQVFFHGNENFYEFDEMGTNIVQFYRKNEKNKCLIIHPKSDTDILQDNINAWMSEITPGVKINFISNPEQDTSRIAIGESGQPNQYRATNVGFGISYSLPIILLLLCSKPGDVLLIENPEAHIHPKGQSKLAELIAMVACVGVQVIIETHSDHVINGIRVAIKKQKISYKNTAINFFYRDKETGISDVKEIIVDKSGELNDWPEDFFDQSIKDLGVLLSN